MFSFSGSEVKKYQDVIEAFLEKMSFSDISIQVKKELEKTSDGKDISVILVDIKTGEPQMLIGQSGQTLFSLQKLLHIILQKKFQELIRLQIDINHYKEKKVYYLKKIAQELAEEVVMTQKEKALPSMSSYERKIIHAELAKRSDVITESRDSGNERYIVIIPK